MRAIVHERQRLGRVVEHHLQGVAVLERTRKRRVVVALQRAQRPLAHVYVPPRVIKHKHGLGPVRHFPELGLFYEPDRDGVAMLGLGQVHPNAKAAHFDAAHGHVPAQPSGLEPRAAAPTHGGVDANTSRIPPQRSRVVLNILLPLTGRCVGVGVVDLGALGFVVG
ncbi:hypothetical protein H257_00357 [Aphanomyces astaci]|uniref:Uncharacterized protein n=1 Tax=Aphanomyces astaci TaxID=112090 RepID=W4HA46_APHAT|nr:hypothetical protein H257_00357 [Aphanomyces astaci]ETV88905.1 hypothetical protein H257_00357 [Aphanomyces astaci]|eukprot:XP_009821305.1 hypothetical protein H257_00357 [Aphanomyces astaci]